MPRSADDLAAQDLAFFQREVAPILPPTILDFHAHTWTSAHWRVKPWEQPGAGRYMVVQPEYPPEQLLAEGRRLFPGHEYHAVCFGYPVPVVDAAADTRYVAAAARYRGLYPLVLAGPALGLTRADYEQRLDEGAFLGYKVFLNWLGDDYGDLRVEDLLSPVELGLANDRGLVVMLHVPRRDRLADPEIQRGVRDLAHAYPNIRLVLAHCGRCYLPAEMKRAIGAVRDLDNVWLDTAMVMDPLVLQIALEAVGPRRLLFATDLPVAAMRGRRVRVMDHWVDVVLDSYPESAWRVASGAIHATYMGVEIVVAIRDAAERVGLRPDELRAIFHDNGIGLLESVMGGGPVRRIRAQWQ